MGCICSKGTTSATDYVESQRENEYSKSTKPLVVTSSRREDLAAAESTGNTVVISKPPQLENPLSAPTILDEVEKPRISSARRSVSKTQHQRRATVDIGANGGEREGSMSRIVTMPRGVEGEQAAAGWPTWLTSVAGDAIQGLVPRSANSFEKLDQIGQGTYSNVYKARDLETGKIVALKKVRFVNMDPESVRFMAREIYILRKLDHPNVVKLEGLITSHMSSSLYLIFEYMEHDLAGLAASRNIKFTEPQIKCYMQQLFRGLEHCHSHGVLHRDIKGSNLLLDNNGNLKIADFGLATFFDPGQKQQLTSRVVTLWYRPPELLLGATEYGAAVDLWSSGCILAELFAGKPIMPGRTEVEQMHKIFKLCGSPSEEYWRKSRLPHATIFKPQHPYKRCLAETFRDFPPSALALLDSLLAIEPESRGSAADALKSDFFTTAPHPCDPSSLPKYPPTKEFDAKMRDEESRRERAAGLDGVGTESRRRNSMAVLAQGANADPQKRQGHCISEKLNPLEDGGSGFPIEPPSRNHLEGSYSTRNGPDLRTQRSYMHQGAVDLSNRSVLSSRSNARLDMPGERSVHAQLPEKPVNSRYNQLDDNEPSDHLLDRPASSHKKVGKPYVPKKRIHYSGPLVPPGGNLEDMLKEHERQIQQAVRKARLDKVKTKKDMGDGLQTESLLHSGS